MTTKFPELPEFQGAKGDEAHFILDKDPALKLLRDTFLPFVYFHLPTLKEMDLSEVNTFLQTFLSTLHQANHETYPDYVRDFGCEGGIGFIHFPDGFVHDHCKAFYYNNGHDVNSMGYQGLMFYNHSDQRSKTYGILRIAKAFADWLAIQRVPFGMHLRMVDADGDLQVID